MKNIMAGIVILMLLLMFTAFLMIVFLNSESVANFNTNYTSGFSYAKFNTIKIGMPKYQVRRVLGDPLYIAKDYFECFSYSTQKPPPSAIPPWDDFAWIDTKVCFDKNGKVAGTWRNIFWN
jgi:outer membrane protein assembly factor BamE (lipoprotein component of BamABCDE complex)